jgi:hypothetical protein
MNYRKLRIAWSVGCGLLAVLLCVLWVRSYWFFEMFSACKVSENHIIAVLSVPGVFCVAINPIADSPPPWSRESTDAVEWWTDAVELEQVPYTSRVIGTFKFELWAVVVPYWFVVSLCAGISTAPWLRRQFSLRTLLIATTIVAVCIGLAVMMLRGN